MNRESEHLINAAESRGLKNAFEWERQDRKNFSSKVKLSDIYSIKINSLFFIFLKVFSILAAQLFVTFGCVVALQAAYPEHTPISRNTYAAFNVVSLLGLFIAIGVQCISACNIWGQYVIYFMKRCPHLLS